MLVRRERPDDGAAVAATVAAAFARDDGTEPVEVGLLARLRTDPAWIPAYSLVASDPDEPDGSVVGHVVATRGDVDGHPALGLGPVAVLPAAQGRGVGSALVHALLGGAEARDETVVVLLGAPAFYERFGFGPAAEVGIAAPDPEWGRYFQARRFTTAAPTGRFGYTAPFAEL